MPLAELHIITNNYLNALNTLEGFIEHCDNDGDRAIEIYLRGIALKMLDLDTDSCVQQLDQILKKGIETDWNFDLLEYWLKNFKIDAEKKNFVIEKIKQIRRDIIKPKKS